MLQPEGGRQTFPYSGNAMAAVAASERPTVGATDLKYVAIPFQAGMTLVQGVFIDYSFDLDDPHVARNVRTPISPTTPDPGSRPFSNGQRRWTLRAFKRDASRLSKLFCLLWVKSHPEVAAPGGDRRRDARPLQSVCGLRSGGCQTGETIISSGSRVWNGLGTSRRLQLRQRSFDPIKMRQEVMNLQDYGRTTRKNAVSSEAGPSYTT